MCESKALLLKDNEEKSIMEDVIILEIQNGKFMLYKIDGKKMELPQEYKLIKIDFLKHKIYFKLSK